MMEALAGVSIKGWIETYLWPAGWTGSHDARPRAAFPGWGMFNVSVWSVSPGLRGRDILLAKLQVCSLLGFPLCS